MKIENTSLGYKMTPETLKEVDRLRAEYPHLWPFESVCVATKPKWNENDLWRMYGKPPLARMRRIIRDSEVDE